MTLPTVKITRAEGLNSNVQMSTHSPGRPPTFPPEKGTKLWCFFFKPLLVSVHTDMTPSLYPFGREVAVLQGGCLTVQEGSLNVAPNPSMHDHVCSTYHTFYLQDYGDMLTVSLVGKNAHSIWVPQSWNLSDKTSVMVKLGELSSFSYWASHGKKNGWLPMQLVTWRKPNVFPQVSWYHIQKPINKS